MIRQTLLAKLRYRRSPTSGPKSNADAVHICFVHGLVNKRAPAVGPISDGWDGAFGDGLVTTYLRHTEGHSRDGLRSRRGLWIGAGSAGLRGALAELHALLRARRNGDIARDRALYWESRLPDVAALAPTYEYSDWVVHLDRELSLEQFASSDAAPTIIEYSDQQVADSPGYDTITVTNYATPYREQLGEILTMAGLTVGPNDGPARTAANRILEEINVLSGSWALDFLTGSIADHRTSLRLKGNVGAALAYRWLRRIEQPSDSDVVEVGGTRFLPVYVGLEDLLRATPAAGLPVRDGLVHRFTNEDDGDEKGRKWCDDLLVLYVPQSVEGQSTQIHGRIVEVKLGATKALRQKAPAQVAGTHELLTRVLSGAGSGPDAPLRHRQLSLLLKAQIERAVAVKAVRRETVDWLNIPVLSRNLATGNYSVDYTIGANGKHLQGDVFLLDTTDTWKDVTTAKVEVEDGVRFITVGRRLVEVLAFEPEDTGTLLGAAPENTLPRLGRYRGVEPTHVGPSPQPATAPAPEPTRAPPPSRAVSVEPNSIVEPVLPPSSPPPAPPPPVAPPTSSPSSPVKRAPYSDAAVIEVVERLERALIGQRIALAGSLSPREVDRGPRLLRVYIQLAPSERLASVQKISEDLARLVGTTSGDIHISNVPERRAVALDLPVAGLEYTVTYDELLAHASFGEARTRLSLGFCAGIDVTGRAVWADLSTMPHMLVAGTTGSGKSVFLRNVILTLVLNRTPDELVLRMSSSKPMDFRAFATLPHTRGRAVAATPEEALALARELITEMEWRLGAITDDPWADNVLDFNKNNPELAIPLMVAVFDEYAEMVSSFEEKADRDEFETAIGRLAQKARAAGIHLVICMQRPDVNAIKGAIKANILHRFALKLPQSTDSRVILDENGAEALLGAGDLLYKDGAGKLNRLQVPDLGGASLRRLLEPLIGSPVKPPQAPRAPAPIPPVVELPISPPPFEQPQPVVAETVARELIEPGTPAAKSTTEATRRPPGSFVADGVPFPPGTAFRRVARGQVQHYALVKDGALWIGERRFTSPSAAAVHLTGMPVNGWTFWEHRAPHSTTWETIDSLRKRVREEQ